MKGNVCINCKHEFSGESIKYRCCGKFSKKEVNKHPEKRDIVICFVARQNQCNGASFEKK